MLKSKPHPISVSPCKFQVNTLDLDPSSEIIDRRTTLIKALKEVQVGKLPKQITRIGTNLSVEVETALVAFLKSNVDVFTCQTSFAIV